MDELESDSGRFGLDYRSTLRSGLQKNLSGESPYVQISRKSVSIFLAKAAHFVTDYSAHTSKETREYLTTMAGWFEFIFTRILVEPC